MERTLSPHAEVSQSDLNELTREVFPTVVVAIVVGVWIATMAAFPRAPDAILLWPIALAAIGFTSWRMVAWNVQVAATLFVGGIALAAIAAVLAFPAGLFAFFLAPVVLIAALLLGPRASVVVAVVSTAVVALAHANGEWGQVSSAETMAIVLIWTTILLALLATRSVYTALGWAWHSYHLAVDKVEELQRHQGELNRIVKSLNDAYYQLEQANVELERARDAAQEARRLKAEFAATISHELRTPLNLIIGFSEMMATSPGSYTGEALTPEYQCDVDSIYRNARHLSSLIDDILDLSQIDAERMALLRETIALGDVVDQAVAATRGLFTGKHLTLDVDVSAELPLVHVDPTRIRQILINLLNNAARFTEQGGVRVTAEVRENQVIVSVADTGPGIVPGDVGKVFEEFRQVDGSIRRRYGGSGLGLAICKSFVELHGGNIWVTSAVPSGSVFSFSLPLADNVVPVPVRREWETWVRPQYGGQTSEPVLVLVDDDPSVAALFRRHLDDWTVISAPDLQDVPVLAKLVPVHSVALTDPSCSSEDGDRLSKEFGIPIVICPVRGRGALRAEMGIMDYLLKPIDREQIEGVLRRVKSLRRVLIADDDPEMVRLLGRMVRATTRSARVIGAYTGGEALEAMTQIRPDLVLLDVMMPDLDGFAVLERMRQDDRLRDIPVVIVSAHGDRAETIRGTYLHLAEPGGLSAAQLMRCLQHCLNALRAEPIDSDRSPRVMNVG
jgi:signal transduction histidine kinase/CheY-like chemotaxis protein